MCCCFRFVKKLEHSWKALVHDGVSCRYLLVYSVLRNTDAYKGLFSQDTVSVHKPGFYSDRFQKFMCNTVFRKMPSKFILSI